MDIVAENHAPCVDAGLVQRAGRTVVRLKMRRLTVVTAESCTAGLISALMAQAEGAGEVLHGSFVVYSKDHKAKALDVDADLLRRSGAVSGPVARQMLAGAMAHSPADLGLAVTGVLGPEPDEDGNPVGRVILAVGRRGGEPCVRQKDYGNQQHDVLRRRVVLDALALLDDLI